MEFLVGLGLEGTILTYFRIMGRITVTRLKRRITIKNRPINP
jgi:hypothetical protein